MTTQTKTVNDVQLESLQFNLAEVWEAIKRNHALLKLAFVLTFLLYLIFNQHLYLGDATGWDEYLKDTSSMMGFGFMVVVTVLMALFLSWVKHHLYIHFGAFGQGFYVVALMIGFALLAEAFSTSASQDVKSRIMLSNDDAYQQTLNAPAPVATNSQLVTDIAAAQRKYQQCVVRFAAGKEKHCQGDRALLKSLKDAKLDEMNVQKHVGVETQKLNYSRQDQLKADSYNPIVVSVAQLIASIAGSDSYQGYIKTAIMTLMMIVAIVFEVLHHVLSRVNGELRERKTEIELQLASISDRINLDNKIRDEFKQATQSAAAPQPEPEPEPAKKKGWGILPVAGVGLGFGADGVSPSAGVGAVAAPRAQSGASFSNVLGGLGYAFKAKQPDQPMSNNLVITKNKDHPYFHQNNIDVPADASKDGYHYWEVGPEPEISYELPEEWDRKVQRKIANEDSLELNKNKRVAFHGKGIPYHAHEPTEQKLRKSQSDFYTERHLNFLKRQADQRHADDGLIHSVLDGWIPNSNPTVRELRASDSRKTHQHYYVRNKPVYQTAGTVRNDMQTPDEPDEIAIGFGFMGDKGKSAVRLTPKQQPAITATRN